MTDMPNEMEIEPVKGVRIWIEQESIHMKVVDQRYGDPVELTEHEAEAVIAALQSLLSRLRQGSAG
jgi:hypothetical protein